MIYGIGTDILKIAPGSGAGATAIASPARSWAAGNGKIPAPQGQSGGSRHPFPGHPFRGQGSLSKAIGMGMRMPMTWRAMQVLNAPSGKPVVVCSGALQQWMEEQGLSAHVTITDEVEYAVAFVIVEKS
jgi:holo-[acyl-carrier protein] synthase